MAKKRHKSKHDSFDRNRILFVMNSVAKERRMARRTGWTASHVCGAYTLWKEYGFGAKRLNDISNKIDAMTDKMENGEIDIEELRSFLDKYAGLGLVHKDYTENEISYRKGSFLFFVDSKQLMPQNEVNRYATEYAIFLLTIMHEENGFGPERLMKLYRKLEKVFNDFAEDHAIGQTMIDELHDYAGVYFGRPRDTITDQVGSIMVGM